MLKSQTAEQVEETRSHTTMVSHPDLTTAEKKATPRSQPSFDDLYAHIAVRACELYVGRGDRENGALEDWLDAEQEILNAKFPS